MTHYNHLWKHWQAGFAFPLGQALFGALEHECKISASLGTSGPDGKVSVLAPVMNEIACADCLSNCLECYMSSTETQNNLNYNKAVVKFRVMWSEMFI